MKVFNDKISTKEGRIAVNDMPSLEDWSDLLKDNEDFAAEFNRLFNNPEVAEADDTFDPTLLTTTSTWNSVWPVVENIHSLHVS